MTRNGMIRVWQVDMLWNDMLRYDGTTVRGNTARHDKIWYGYGTIQYGYGTGPVRYMLRYDTGPVRYGDTIRVRNSYDTIRR